MPQHLPTARWNARFLGSAVLAAAVLAAAGVARADDPPPPTGRFFEQHDKNGDGKVAADEFTGDKEVFRLLDKDGDGVVTPAEVGLPPDFKPRPRGEPPGGPGAGPGGPGGPGGGDYLRRLKEMDRDADGKITREEFTGEPERFDRLDRNKDGALDASDLEQMAREGGGRLRERMREKMKEMDKDGDGRVSREEFSGPIPFDQLDRNKDGFLDAADVPEKGPDGPGAGRPGKGGRGPGGKGPGLTPEALRRFDSNADGRVTADEFPGNAERFAQLDRNKDGSLTAEDVAPAAPPLPAEGTDETGPRPPKRPGGDLRAMDADGNGKISRDEFRGGDEDWRHLDRNQDGWIAGDEFPAPPGNALVRLVLEELVRRDDRDSDGRIAKGEFTGPADRFAALDRNHDGYLDPSDAH